MCATLTTYDASCADVSYIDGNDQIKSYDDNIMMNDYTMICGLSILNCTMKFMNPLKFI